MIVVYHDVWFDAVFSLMWRFQTVLFIAWIILLMVILLSLAVYFCSPLQPPGCVDDIGRVSPFPFIPFSLLSRRNVYLDSRKERKLRNIDGMWRGQNHDRALNHFFVQGRGVSE